MDWDCELTIEHPDGASDSVDPLRFMPELQSIPDQCGQFEGARMNASALFAGRNSSVLHPMLEDGFLSFQHSIVAGQPEQPVSEDVSAIPWLHGTQDGVEMAAFQSSWADEKSMAAEILIDPMDQWIQLQTIEPSHKPDFCSPVDSPIALDGPSDFGCDCYKHAMGELLRFGHKRETNGYSTIDSILACQKELLLQTEIILRCKLCSQSEAQANMLMVIVVTIDGLLTSLDATASWTKASVQHETSSARSDSGSKRARHSSTSTGFISHIDACPLQVGAFQVPGDEKSWFVRQIFQARLSSLLGAIRRIRVYMQEHLAVALSRGRLMMIMETDRRLQLILMKVKMAIS